MLIRSILIIFGIGPVFAHTEQMPMGRLVVKLGNK